jgi:pteridine reductase
MFDLTDRIIWITGSAKRVGRGVALACAKAGAHVAVHCNNSRDEAEEVRRQIEDLGRRALIVQGDHGLRADVEKMVGDIRREFGRLDALVNCAATFPRVEFEETTDEDLDGVIAANLKGPFLCTQLALPLLRAAEKPHVINITDCMQPRPYAYFSAYWCAKGGLDALTRALARELGPEVRVNAVAPGPVLPPPDYTEFQKQDRADKTFLKQWGSPEDVAHAVLYLLTSDFVTGTTMPVDGGRHLN